MEGTEEVGSYVMDTWAGWGGCKDFRNILKGGCTEHTPLWIGDVGDEPPNRLDNGEIPPQGGPRSEQNPHPLQVN